MLSEKRVVTMTKLAMKEKDEPRQMALMQRFWFNDYLTTELWKAFLISSAGFWIVTLLVLVAVSDDWTYTYHLSDVVAGVKKLLMLYAVTEVFSLLLCLESHLYRYLKTYRKREEERRLLRQMDRLYKAQERMEKKTNER